LVPLIIARAVAMATAARVRGAQRRWAIASSILLAASAGLAVPAQRALWRVDHDWDEWRRSSTIRGLAALRAALDDAVTSSDQVARAGLGVPQNRTQAF